MKNIKNMKRIKSKKIILSDGLFDGYVYFADGKIIEVTDKEYDAEE